MHQIGNRLLLIRMLSLLWQHGGKPIVAESSNGARLLDIYIDLIADVEKREERGARTVDWLTDTTVNDPTVY